MKFPPLPYLQVPDTPRWRQAAAFIGAVLIISTAAWVMVARNHRLGLAPDDASLQIAADALGKELQPGDAIVFIPGWSAAEPWRFVQKFEQRQLDFNAALRLSDPLDPWDFDGFKRVWVVSTHGFGRSVELPKPAIHASARDYGHGTALDLFELPASTTVFDAYAQLANAKVQRETKKGIGDLCTWQNNHFECPGNGWWLQIWAFESEVGTGRRRCIFVQPSQDGQVTRMTWKSPPAAREIAGHFGLRMWGVRVDEGSDTTFRVKMGERVLTEHRIAKGDFSYIPWRAEIAPPDQGQDLVIEIEAAQVSWRQTCFDARLLGPPHP